MNMLEIEQGTDAWKKARAGHVTASRVSDVMARIKSGEAAARRDYKFQLVAEILSGQPQDDGFVSEAMAYGTTFEPVARAAYEAAAGVLVTQVGFVTHPTIARVGASPDGCVGETGLIEIKVPKLATHLNYILDGVVPAKYHNQMLLQMACCERAWCDFVSFRPDLPEQHQLFIVRFPRDDTRIAAMTAEVKVFLEEVDALLDQLNYGISDLLLASVDSNSAASQM